MFDDRVSFSTATTGTGTITQGAVDAGFVGLSGISDGEIRTYCITDGSEWETGYGMIAAGGTTLSRTLSRSSTAALLNLSGSAKCFLTPIAEDLTKLKAFELAGASAFPAASPDDTMRLSGFLLAGLAYQVQQNETGLANIIDPHSVNRMSMWCEPGGGSTPSQRGGI